MAADLRIRPFTSGDMGRLYDICIQTMDAGRDASALYQDRRLPGLYYAAPYAQRDPDLCLVACLDGVVSGYVLGTDDSVGFGAWCEEHWFPAWRSALPRPGETESQADASLLGLIHSGYRPHPDLLAYPGHLHIDLLPCLQGRGIGRLLVSLFSDLLRARSCPAFHLGVSERNPGACAFYQRIGLTELGRYTGWRAYGRSLRA